MEMTERGDINTTDPTTVEDQAERVVVSFRSPETDPDQDDDWWIADSDWLRENMMAQSYRRYLRWAHAGSVALGEEWDEFVNCGCASPEDVILRVEEIDGGIAIGAQTTIVVIPRKTILEEDAGSPGQDAG
jgi:hypothetical protein